MPSPQQKYPDFRSGNLLSLIMGDKAYRGDSFAWLASEIAGALNEALRGGLGDDALPLAQKLAEATDAVGLWKLLSERCAMFAEGSEMKGVRAVLQAADALANGGLPDYLKVVERYSRGKGRNISESYIGGSEPVLDVVRNIARGWYAEDPDAEKYWKKADKFILAAIGGDGHFFRDILDRCRDEQPFSTLTSPPPAVPETGHDLALDPSSRAELEKCKASLGETLAKHGLDAYIEERDRIVQEYQGKMHAADFDGSVEVLAAAESVARLLAKSVLMSADPRDTQDYVRETQRLINAGVGSPDFYNYLFFDAQRGKAWGT